MRWHDCRMAPPEYQPGPTTARWSLLGSLGAIAPQRGESARPSAQSHRVLTA